jgi:hypothetical protein
MEPTKAPRIVSTNRMVAVEQSWRPARRTAETDRWNVVRIALTDEQSQALHELTGERIGELRLQVEDLIDLSDLVAN